MAKFRVEVARNYYARHTYEIEASDADEAQALIATKSIPELVEMGIHEVSSGSIKSANDYNEVFDVEEIEEE